MLAGRPRDSDDRIPFLIPSGRMGPPEVAKRASAASGTGGPMRGKGSVRPARQGLRVEKENSSTRPDAEDLVSPIGPRERNAAFSLRAQ